MPPFGKPRLPSNYYVWFEPPDDSGDEVLHFVSGRRRLKVKGHSFREFVKRVAPLLDGNNLWSEIQEQVADIFRPEDLAECLDLLARQNILEDAAEDPAGGIPGRLEPQLNLFRELGNSAGGVQKKLAAATVSVVGLGGCGPAAAMSLAAAGVGTLNLTDPLPVRETDVYFTPALPLASVGAGRAAAVGAIIAGAAPQVAVRTCDSGLDNEAGLSRAVENSSFVVCCLDAGQANLIFKLNRVCLELALPWTNCAMDLFRKSLSARRCIPEKVRATCVTGCGRSPAPRIRRMLSSSSGNWIGGNRTTAGGAKTSCFLRAWRETSWVWKR